jgi:hypothetical protein
MGLVIGNLDKAYLPNTVLNAVTDTSSKRYGVKFTDFTTANAGIRTYDAANMNFSISTATTAGTDDFLSVSPFNIKECITQYNSTTKKREVLAYEGDSNWAALVTNKTGDRMIEFPKFYYKRPSRYEWIVSPDPITGFSPSPMHYRNGVMHDYARISKYTLSSGFISQTGTSPLVSQTLQQFRTGLRAKGQYVLDYASSCSLFMLMAIKYATLNVQSKIGWGHCTVTNTAVLSNGGADGIKGKDGTVSDITVDESILCMGIENYYGNLNRFADGIIRVGNQIYLNTDIENISDWPASTSSMAGWTASPTTVYAPYSNSDSYCAIISELAYDSTYPWANYPTNCTNPVLSANWKDNFTTNNNGFIDGGYWFQGNGETSMHVGLISAFWGSGSGCGTVMLGLLGLLSISQNPTIGAFALELP